MDYAEAINSLDLAEVCRAVVLDTETMSGFADQGVQIPGRPGVVLDPEADRLPLVLTLRTAIRYTDDDGDITDTDGAEGHFEANLAAVKRELSSRRLSVLRRTFPHKGRLRAYCRLTDQFQADDRGVYGWNLIVPSGSWQDDTESSETGNPPSPIITSGDTEIHDPRLSISAAGTTTVTLGDGTVYTIVAQAGPAYPIVVDVGAGTVKDNGNADARGHVVFSHQHWLRLLPNDTAAVTSSAAVTVFWRNRWS